MKCGARLWRGGVSQPPFLLALGGRYAKLDLRFDVRGLGRVDIGCRSSGGHVAPHKMLRKELRRVGTFRQKFHPAVAPLADEAFVLHFTGELKPWRLSASYAEQWTTHGAALTPTGHVAGGCELDQQLSGLMDRRIYYCRKHAPCGDARVARVNTTTSRIPAAGHARVPHCAARRGVATCACSGTAAVARGGARRRPGLT